MKAKVLGPKELNRLLTLKTTVLRSESISVGHNVKIFKTKNGIIIGKVQKDNSLSVDVLQIDNPMDFEISQNISEHCIRMIEQ
jgi:hypothetical protein